jgi:hypothetical protein
MDIFEAVFNQHVNNAGKIAIKTVNKMFDKNNTQLIELNRMYKEGIMEIFKVETNNVTGVYVGIVYYLVNKYSSIKEWEDTHVLSY